MSRRASASGGDEHQLLQPAGPQQRRVDQVGPVGRAEHDDVAQRLDAVELGEQRGDHPVGDPGVEALPAPRRQRVDLVEEHQRRRRIACPAEQFAHRLLRRAHPLVHQLGALDGVHRQPAACWPARGPGTSCRSRAGRRAARRAAARRRAGRTCPGCCSGHSTASVSACLVSTMSPTSSRVTDADRDLLGGRPRQRADHRQRADQVVLASARAACRRRWPAPPPAARPRAPARPGRRRRNPVCARRSRRGRASRRARRAAAPPAAPCGWRRRAGSGRARGRTGRGPAAARRRASGTADVATNATPGVATAVRSSVRISVRDRFGGRRAAARRCR